MVLMIKKSYFKILETEEKGLLEMQFTQVTVEETGLERINNVPYVTQWVSGRARKKPQVRDYS